MFGIPDWAIGSAFISAVFFGALGLMIRFMHASRRSRLSQQDRDLLEALRTKAAEMEELHKRLAEVEERLDFAERLLAQERHVERIAPPTE